MGTFGQHDTYSTSLPTKPSDLAGTALGAEGRVWLMPRFGFPLWISAGAGVVRRGGQGYRASEIAGNVREWQTFEFPPTVPAYTALLVDREDHLWGRLFPSADRSVGSGTL